MTPREIEKALVAACLWAQENGWTIVAGSNGSEFDNTCCPVGALAVGCEFEPSDGWDLTEIGRLLRWSGFANGFDGKKRYDHFNPTLYRLGRRLRRRFIEPTK